MIIRKYTAADIDSLRDIWNEVVLDGIAFPQDNPLGEDAASFFESQTYTGVADDNGDVVGLYILHPNNVGRCGHICNASYAVRSDMRGKGIGRLLVSDCIARAPEFGFKVLQFNAVVESNTAARRLYESLGFTQLGTIKGGFRTDSGYVNICPYYIEL